jgi:hypothetical protein
MYNINERFTFLNKLTGMVVDGLTPSLIITGEGGLGKTHSILSVIKEKDLYPFEYHIIKGYSTARGLYNTLYDNNHKLIIFDDCDSILEDKVAINILKSALDSYETRKISWMAKMNKNDEYPQSFDFGGRIIFISNKNRNSIDDAIISRSLTVDLSMTPEEKIERMSHIISSILPDYPINIKLDALNYLNEKKDEIQLNLRSLIITSKLRMAHPDSWEDLANYMISTK